MERSLHALQAQAKDAEDRVQSARARHAASATLEQQHHDEMQGVDGVNDQGLEYGNAAGDVGGARYSYIYIYIYIFMCICRW